MGRTPARQALGDHPQDLIAGQVSVGVVDELEVVEVDHEDPQRLLGAVLQLLHGRHLHDGLAIPKAGEHVDAGLHLEFFVRRRQRHLRIRQHRDLDLVFGQRRQVAQRIEVIVVEVARRGVTDAQDANSLPLEMERHAGVEDPGVGERAIGHPGVSASVVDEADLVVQDGVVAIAVLAEAFERVEPLHALQPRQVLAHEVQRGQGDVEQALGEPRDSIEALLSGRAEQAGLLDCGESLDLRGRAWGFWHEVTQSLHPDRNSDTACGRRWRRPHGEPSTRVSMPRLPSGQLERDASMRCIGPLRWRRRAP